MRLPTAADVVGFARVVANAVVAGATVSALAHLPPAAPAAVEDALRRRVLEGVGVRATLAGLLLAVACGGCGSTPTVIDSGVYGGAWTVVEWRGTLIELSTEASCTSKRSCAVSVCVTVSGGERVCRESAGEVRPPGLRTGEGAE